MSNKLKVFCRNHIDPVEMVLTNKKIGGGKHEWHYTCPNTDCFCMINTLEEISN